MSTDDANGPETNPNPDPRYGSKTHCSPLWLDTKPVFLGTPTWCDGKRTGVRIHGTGAELRVDRDEPQIRYRRKLRFVLTEAGAIERILDERGCAVDLAEWGNFDTTDRRVLTLDVISEQPNPRFTIEEDVDGAWYHPVDGVEPSFVPTGEDPERYLGCTPTK